MYIGEHGGTKQVRRSSAEVEIQEVFHKGGTFDVGRAIAMARQEGIEVTWRTIARLRDRSIAGLASTEQTIEFLTAVIGSSTGSTVLDPWAGAGVLLASFADRIDLSGSVGLVAREEELAVAEQLSGLVSWRLGYPLQSVETLVDEGRRFDLIVSTPPWGVRSPIRHQGDPRVARLTIDAQIVLASCGLLADKGPAYFVVPNAFLIQMERGLRALLAERGLYLWSSISLPPSWNPSASLAANLIEVRREPIENLFVAKASADSSNEALLGNYAARSSGRLPEVGAIVPAQDFSTWESYEAALIFQAAARTLRGSVIELSSIVLDRALGKRTSDGSFVDRPNVVFLPIIGTSPAVTSRSDLQIKAHNYIQLVLDPELADAEYVARYFNSPVGHLTRQVASTGSFISKASLSRVDKSPIVLPPLQDQANLVGLQRRLDDLRAQLDTANRDLWRTSDGSRSVTRLLNRFPDDDGIESWLPRLPFPLASILWTYHSMLDTRRRSEVLFAFFEAVAEFVTTILLSGLYSNASIYEELRGGPLSELEGTLWRQASLGFWIVAGRNLAKTVRSMLSDERRRSSCLDVFRCSGSWLEPMASKDIFAVLERVNELRNQWKGHGGIESDRETALRLERLEAELTGVFNPLTRAFEDLLLIRPKSFQFDGQVYDLIAEDLIGHGVPFRETKRRVVRPLKSGALYILERDGVDGLELLPFVRMKSGPPAATACYFYSRLGKDGVRFVSYHQAEESEMTEVDAELAALVTELSGQSQ